MGKLAISGAKDGRRQFLFAAGAGAATIAMPQVSRAQTSSWQFQSAWSQRDIFHEFAHDYARKVGAMTGERLKIEVLPAGAVVPPFQLQDAVHAGILTGGHGTCLNWYRKHKAFSLFGTPPSFGWDSSGMLAWFYRGGGEALYKELVTDILKLNVIGFLYFPMPTQPLGWFKKEIKSPDEFKGLKYRTVGLASEMFKELGVEVNNLLDRDMVRAIDRDLLDGAEVNNPSSDLLLGFPEVVKFYMMGSHHRQVECFEIIFNKSKYEALTAEMKAILRYAAFASSADQLGMAHDRYPNDLAEIMKRGVNVVKTNETILNAQLAAWDRVIAAYSKDPFFAKVVASQKAWVKRTQPYIQINNLDNIALAAAYKHFFS
jgi:TRAP-type mannitol/chloroaromatic compound transport system substrate-binding protein